MCDDGVVLKHQYGNMCPDCQRWRHRIMALNLPSNDRVFMGMKKQLPTACRAYCLTNSDLGFKLEDRLCKEEFSLVTRALSEDSLISLTLVMRRATQNFNRLKENIAVKSEYDIDTPNHDKPTVTIESAVDHDDKSTIDLFNVQTSDLDEMPSMVYVYDSDEEAGQCAQLADGDDAVESDADTVIMTHDTS